MDTLGHPTFLHVFGTDETVLWNIPCVPLHRPILHVCVRPIPLSYVGLMGQSYGIPCVPLYGPYCVRPIPLSYVGHMGQSYGIPCVPLYRPILYVCPIPLSYVGQMGQSYEIPCVPLFIYSACDEIYSMYCIILYKCCKFEDIDEENQPSTVISQSRLLLTL